MEAVETAVVEQPTAPVVEIPTEPPPLSVSDHAAVYGPKAGDDPDAPEGETAAEKAVRLHHSAEQKRQKTGEFAPGKVKHRAESQKARAEDVPRIQQLTARAKGAEEKLTAAESRLAAAEAELARLKSQHAPAAQIAKAEQKVEAAETKVTATASGSTFKEPAPKEDDERFGGDYGAYLEARAEWAGRKAYHDEKANERAASEREKTQAELRTKAEKFNARVDAAIQKYGDAFEPAANRVIQQIPPDSVITAWLQEHPKAEDVVYYLDGNKQELSRVLGLSSALDQIEALTLLAQRFVSSTPEQVGPTTATAGKKPIIVLPKPPTVVRTEAQPRSDGPPPMDGSLSQAEHRKLFAPKRR
jgi:hypothetical protein